MSTGGSKKKLKDMPEEFFSKFSNEEIEFMESWEEAYYEGKDGGKYDKAWFEFTVEPEDSKFLKSWNELREDEEFKSKINKLKKELNNLDNEY